MGCNPDGTTPKTTTESTTTKGCIWDGAIGASVPAVAAPQAVPWRWVFNGVCAFQVLGTDTGEDSHLLVYAPDGTCVEGDTCNPGTTPAERVVECGRTCGKSVSTHGVGERKEL